MNSGVQWVLAAVIVAVALFFSTWRLLAAHYRLRLLTAAAAVLPPFVAQSRFFMRLHAKVRAQLSDGCGACAARAPAVRARR